MASLHFIASAPVLARDDNRDLGRRVAIEVEVEGSAGIKSRADLVRAARSITCESSRGLLSDTEVVGDFTVTETKEIGKSDHLPLTSSEWPGVMVWRVYAEPPLAA